MGLDRFYYLVLMESIGLTRKKKKKTEKKKKRGRERLFPEPRACGTNAYFNRCFLVITVKCLSVKHPNMSQRESTQVVNNSTPAVLSSG